MPYEIVETEGQYCVMEKGGGTIKCHKTKQAAEEHLAALYANVEDAKSSEALVVLGSGIKSLGNGRYGGTLVRFTPKGDYDLTGDRFDAATDYGFKPGEVKSGHLFLHHAQPVRTKSGKQIHIPGEIGIAEMKFTENAIEVILEAHAEYKELLERSYKALGLSSGTAQHLVIREPEDGGYYIKRWFLGDDVSVTPSPAERRNAVYALKTLPEFVWDDAPQAEPEDAATTASAQAASHQNSTTNSTGVRNMDEKEIKALQDRLAALETELLTVEQRKEIKRLLENYATLEKEHAAMKKALEAEPPRGSGVQVDPGQKYPYKGFVRNTRGTLLDATGYGEFLQDVFRAGTEHSVSPRLASVHDLALKSLKASGLNAAIPSQGGFFTQTDHNAELVREMFETGAIVSSVRKFGLGANADSLTLNGVDETSRASTLWGGIVAYWKSEAATLTASKPKFREIRLEVNPLTALYYATDKLLKTAPALGAVVAEGFREAMTFKVEDAIINGDGAGKPLGIMNIGSMVSVAKESGQTAATIVHENISKMKARMFPSAFARAIWLANIDTQPQWDLLSFTIGTAGTLSPFVTYGQDGVMRAYGRPVVFVEHCQTLGTTGDVILWDPTSYLFVDLGAVEEASSIHVQFTTAETAFRFMYYCDGQPKLASALTPAHGTNTLSHQVKLDTRA